MSLFFANPAGFWILAGVPVVVLIHLLRRQSRQIRTTTLFLVQEALKSREGGRRVQTLRNTLPLWLQILAILCLAMFFAGPRWLDETSSLEAVIVVDSSASMGAFREETREALVSTLRTLGSVAGRLDVTVLSTEGEVLARGGNAAEVLEKADASWQPVLGVHSSEEALRLARQLAGAQGVVVLVTDHPPQEDTIPEDLAWISVGSRTENAAFLGGNIEGDRWTARVRNFADTEKSLRWRVAGEPDWRAISVQGGGIAEFSGTLPESANRVVLELEPDALEIDNLLPLIRPVSKPLTLQSSGDGALMEGVRRLAEPLSTGLETDISVVEYDPLQPGVPAGNAIVFLKDPSVSGLKPLSGSPIAENDPLMQDLDWRGLTVTDSLRVPFREGDAALLWLGERPLIFLRYAGQARQLIFNFDVPSSNATRLPAFALLLHRFLEDLREEKSAYSAGNLATGERLPVPGNHRAPTNPGHFAHNAPDGNLLFEGAAAFGDPRESDLRLAASGSEGVGSWEAIRKTNAAGEEWNNLWLLLAGALILWNFWLTGSVPQRPGAKKATFPGIARAIP